MSGDFIRSVNRSFTKSPNRDRNYSQALLGGTITYISSRSGWPGTGAKVYKKLRATLGSWVQVWEYRDEYFTGFQRSFRPPIPSLISEQNADPLVPRSGRGYAQRKFFGAGQRISETLYKWPNTLGSLDLTIEFFDPKPLSEHIDPILDAFQQDVNFPGTATNPSTYYRKISRIGAFHEPFISLTTQGIELIRSPAELKIAQSAYDHFNIRGTFSNDSATPSIIRPEDEQFLNRNADNFSGAWPLCGFNMQGISASIDYELSKSSLEKTTYKRALYIKPTRFTYEQLNCVTGYADRDGILRIHLSEIEPEIQTQDRIISSEFFAVAGGTGDPTIDRMTEGLNPQPTCF